MSDVRRTSAAGPVPPLRHPLSAAVAALGQLEAQRSCHWVGFREPERQPLSHSVRFAALVANQGPRCLVITEIFAAEVLRQQQSVAAEILDRREEAERLNAGDPALDE